MSGPEPRWYDSVKKWRIQIYENRKIVKSFSSSDSTEAGRKAVMKAYRDWKSSAMKAADPHTLRYYWNEYIKWSSEKDRNGAASINNKVSIYKQYIDPQIGDRKLADLEYDDYQELIDRLMTVTVKSGPRKGQRGLSMKTISSVKAELSSFGKWCKRKKLEAPDASLIEIPAKAKTSGKEILEPEQVRALFDPKYDSAPSVNCFRFLVATGVRPGEAAGLQWSDITGDLVTLSRGVDQRGNITDLKNENAHRPFILTKHAKRALEKQRAIQAAAGITSEWVFSYDGGAPKLKTIYTHWHGKDREKGRNHSPGLADALGCPKVSLYSLRHSYITILREDGVALDDVRAVVGHSASMDTDGTYTHTTRKKLENIAKLSDEAMDKFLE